ncbi:uncharacterized protein ARMOST_18106 [Armillaria ostoyae]|uniref:Uncharacterized protein n=1 Tax=Armillaria ostoyae TaxID=47428 RepID=A0A284S0U7_ARMOS|nr:uncharacterized protein ARMOST_18106 [Armillaria ostoyae]
MQSVSKYSRSLGFGTRQGPLNRVEGARHQDSTRPLLRSQGRLAKDTARLRLVRLIDILGTRRSHVLRVWIVGHSLARCARCQREYLVLSVWFSSAMASPHPLLVEPPSPCHTGIYQSSRSALPRLVAVRLETDFKRELIFKVNAMCISQGGTE